MQNRLLISIILLLAFTGKVFAMNSLQQQAVLLKQKGYRQDIVPGDMTYSPQGDQYVKFDGDVAILPPNWVKVPQTVEIMNELIDCQYAIAHSSTSDGHGGYKEVWLLDDKGQEWTADNIWVVISNYWVSKKGK